MVVSDPLLLILGESPNAELRTSPGRALTVPAPFDISHPIIQTLSNTGKGCVAGIWSSSLVQGRQQGDGQTTYNCTYYQQVCVLFLIDAMVILTRERGSPGRPSLWLLPSGLGQAMPEA